MNCLRKPTRPMKVSAPNRSSILEKALRNTTLLSSTESLNSLPLDAPPPAPLSPLLSPPLQVIPTSIESTSTPPLQASTAKTDSTAMPFIPSKPSPPVKLQPPSEKFLKLLEFRKRCQSLRTPYTYTFLKGPKKSERCGRASCICSVLCSQHRTQARSAKSTPITLHPVKKLWIGRLKRGKK